MSRPMPVLALTATALLLASCSAGAQETATIAHSSAAATETATPTASPTTKAPSRAQSALDALETSEEDASGFTTAAFGPELTDLDFDGNGCTTYDDALGAHLVDVTYKDKAADPCTVMTGSVEDPYANDSAFYSLARTRQAAVDRLVSLEDAWVSGASDWTDEQRREFANDVETMLVVTTATAKERAAADGASWLPQHNTCFFIGQQMQVKTDYNLSVDPKERQALEKALADC